MTPKYRSPSRMRRSAKQSIKIPRPRKIQRYAFSGKCPLDCFTMRATMSFALTIAITKAIGKTMAARWLTFHASRIAGAPTPNQKICGCG